MRGKADVASERLPFSYPFGRLRRRLAAGVAARYNRGMIEMHLPPAPELCATLQAPDPARLVEQLATLRLENAALRAQNSALQQRIRDLEARLGQNSSNSSRPPSADPPQ